MKNKIIDIFYSEIIKEAVNGIIYSYYKNEDDNIPYNIVFNTRIYEEGIYLKSKINNSLLEEIFININNIKIKLSN